MINIIGYISAIIIGIILSLICSGGSILIIPTLVLFGGLSIKKAISKEFKNSIDDSTNPYGDGKSSKRILDVVLSTKINDRLLIKGITS